VLGGTLEVQFDGDDVAWLVALVEYDGSEQVGLAIGEIDDGVGSVALETSGDNSVYMVVSPLKHTENTYDYEFTATLEASESTGDDDDDDDDDDTETDDTDTVTDDDGEPGVDATANEDGTITLNASGCACGTTGAGGGGGLVAAGAVLASAFSRRRPS
jgi:MYXO-CTERM domain-containing protein